MPDHKPEFFSWGTGLASNLITLGARVSICKLKHWGSVIFQISAGARSKQNPYLQSHGNVVMSLLWCAKQLVHPSQKISTVLLSENPFLGFRLELHLKYRKVINEWQEKIINHIHTRRVERNERLSYSLSIRFPANCIFFNNICVDKL